MTSLWTSIEETRLSRVEVLAGRERHRRWSAEQKLEIVRASFEAGVTIAEVARRFDVTRQQVYQWRSDCRAGRLMLAVDEVTRFASVDVVPAAVSSASNDGGQASDHAGFTGHVEVGLVGGRCLRIPVGIDEGMLQRLIRVVEAA
jgi:transposase